MGDFFRVSTSSGGGGPANYQGRAASQSAQPKEYDTRTYSLYKTEKLKTIKLNIGREIAKIPLSDRASLEGIRSRLLALDQILSERPQTDHVPKTLIPIYRAEIETALNEIKQKLLSPGPAISPTGDVRSERAVLGQQAPDLFAEVTPTPGEILPSVGDYEMPTSMSDFEDVHELAEGSFGTTSRVTVPAAGIPGSNLQPGRTYVVKKICLSGMGTDEMRAVMREIHIGARLGKHPFVARTHGWFRATEGSKQNIYIVQDYCQGGELFDHIKAKTKRFTYPEIRKMMAQILLGLLHLKQSNMIHRDMKPENVMLDAQGNCRIIDFGTSIQTGPSGRRNSVVGSLPYLDPRIAHQGIAPQEEYDDTVDLWSAGVTAFVIRNLDFPFDVDSFEEVKRNVSLANLTFPTVTSRKTGAEIEVFSNEMQSFCRDLMTHTSTIEGILQHDFIRETVHQIAEEQGITIPQKK